MTKNDLARERPEREVVDIVAMMAQDQLWALLHERFREMEELHGLTQAELARKVGCDRQSVNRWLSGPSNIGIFNAAKLFAGMEADVKLAYEPWRTLAAKNYYRCFDEEPRVVRSRSTATFRKDDGVTPASGSVAAVRIIPAEITE